MNMIDKTCLYCKKSFSVINSRKDSATFCSNDCKNANNKLLSGKKRYNWKPKISKHCKVCGVLFVVPQKRKNTAFFCSKSCRAKNQYKDGCLKNSKKVSRNTHPNWKGGSYIHKGYVLVWLPKHPSNKRNYVYKHRLVLEKHLGRYLTKDEIVHHKNEIKTDNRLSNLVLTNRSEHISKYHCKNK